ncbi:MAG TPA: trypsin-like peptidase domain-containing protein [Patescibacteria group bacterium]
MFQWIRFGIVFVLFFSGCQATQPAAEPAQQKKARPATGGQSVSLPADSVLAEAIFEEAEDENLAGVRNAVCALYIGGEFRGNGVILNHRLIVTSVNVISGILRIVENPTGELKVQRLELRIRRPNRLALAEAELLRVSLATDLVIISARLEAGFNPPIVLTDQFQTGANCRIIGYNSSDLTMGQTKAVIGRQIGRQSVRDELLDGAAVCFWEVQSVEEIHSYQHGGAVVDEQGRLIGILGIAGRRVDQQGKMIYVGNVITNIETVFGEK